MARIDLPSPTSPGGKRKSSQKGAGQKEGQKNSQDGQQSQDTMQRSTSASDGHIVSGEGIASDPFANHQVSQYDQSASASQSQQASYDVNTQVSTNQPSAETFDAFGEYGTHHDQQQGSVPSYAHTGIDVGMYGLTSPLSSPLSGDLTSPTALNSGVGMGGATSPDLGNHTASSVAPNALQMQTDFFTSPVPLFDSDLLASMQSMQDPSLWQDMPGTSYFYLFLFRKKY